MLAKDLIRLTEKLVCAQTKAFAVSALCETKGLSEQRSKQQQQPKTRPTADRPNATDCDIFTLQPNKRAVRSQNVQVTQVLANHHPHPPPPRTPCSANARTCKLIVRASVRMYVEHITHRCAPQRPWRRCAEKRMCTMGTCVRAVSCSDYMCT